MAAGPAPVLRRLAASGALVALCALAQCDQPLGTGPTTLAFTVQPVSATAGAVLTPGVQVAARNASGNTVTSFAGPVTVSITPGTGSPGATLSGTTTVVAVAGVATFTTLSLDKAGTGYTLSAATERLAGATSAALAINPGPAAQLGFTVQPRTSTAGVTLAPALQVAAQDALGNTASSFTGDVTLAITSGTGASGATLSGTTSVPAVAGVATFSTLRIDKSGSKLSGTGYTLSAMAAGLAGATSDPFDIEVGAATRLVFIIPPTMTRAGTHIAPPIQVAASDAAGNTVPDFTGDITVAIETNPAGGTLSGTATVAAVAGVATFSTLSIDKSAAGYTLSASAAGLSSAASTAFEIVPGTATQLVFTGQPGTTTAGATMAPAVRVTARDALGNAATDFVGNVTVAIGANPAGGVLTGATTLAAFGGTATFSSLRIDQSGSAYTLVASAAGLASATSAHFDVLPSTAHQLLFTVQPGSATAGQPIAPAVQVTAVDASGNIVAGFTDSVTVSLGANAAGATLSGTTTVAALSGVATFSTLTIDKSGTGYTISAAAARAGLTGPSSAAFTVAAAAATELVFLVQPSSAPAGGSITPQVEVAARDAFGNRATGFSRSVTVALGTNPGGGTLSGTTTVGAVAGVASFPTLGIDKSGTGYALTAAASGLRGATSSPFDITAAPAARLVFTTQPTNATAGAAIAPAVQVTARDPLGNTVTGFTGDVTLTITSGTGTGGARLSGGGSVTAAALAGVATFSALTIDKSGTGYTLSATTAGVAGTTSATFAITAGSATQLAFTVQPSGAAAGASFAPAVQVAAWDALGNTATSFSGNVTIALGANPAGGTLSGSTTTAAVGGTATFASLRITQSGTGYRLAAAAPGLTGATSAAFTITPGGAAQLVFIVQPGPATAGTTIAPAVQIGARDALGNAVPGFAGSVTLALGNNPGGGTLGGATTVAAVAGVATFSDLRVDKSATGYTLFATAAGLPGTTSAAFPVRSGPAARLAFTVPPTTATAGGAIKPAVRVTTQDALGNAATDFLGNVTVAIATNPAGGSLSGTRTLAPISGVATFPSLRIDNVGNGYTLEATAAGLTGMTSAPFDIVASTATRLVFAVEPVDSQVAGTVITPASQVLVEDASGSPVTGFTGNVTVAIEPGSGISGATLSGTTTAPAVGGVATFSDLRIDKSGAWYTVLAAAAGLQPTLTSFRVIPGAPTRLAFTLQPSTATARAVITPQVEVTVRDALGNTTGFTGDVTVALADNPAGGTLSGTTTVPAVAGVAAFRDLRIDRAGTGYTLSATAAGVTAATSAAFDITAARATQLVFTTPPTGTIAGVTLNPAVQVTARDASGQTATGFTGDVSVTITAGSGTPGATLLGTTTVAAVAGVATFSTLKINESASAYRLSATAAGVAGSSSPFFTVSPGAPTHLTFTPQRIPGETDAPWPTAGATITPAIPVVARDALENAVRTFAGDVTVAIGDNPGGGTLSGTTTVRAVDGVATFNDLSIDRTGTGYDLRATGGGLGSATSDGFMVRAGPAAYLLFTVQPSTSTATGVIRPAVRVTAFDALGNPATGFSGDVTLAITAGTGAAGAGLSGTTTVAAANGVAIFSTLAIDRAGSGFRLSATATGVTGAASIPFDVN